MNTNPVVITGMARTPQGNLLGELKDLSAPELGGIAIKAAIERSGLNENDVEEVLMGCVLPAGQGQAPARQAAIYAGVPVNVPCTTVNKMCGSGMKTVMLAYDALLSGSANIIVAGGMESMTNAPYLLPKARAGYRFGHGQVMDHMLLDGLEDAYDKGKPMGYFAEQCASEYKFSRKDQDDYAISSFENARKAATDKAFLAEIVPVKITTRQGEKLIEADERPFSVNLEKISQLSPAFAKEGTVTAGNASSISDGAAALVLMQLDTAKAKGVQPIAKILGHSSHAQEPKYFTTAPIKAIQKLLKKVNWTIEEVDLFEINEAFAVVTLAAMHDLSIPREKLNVHGGGCALGHPIGATGTRIIITLLAALKQRGLKRGIAALCIGGGEATAVAIEMI